MGTKKYKPTTPGFRTRQINDYEELTVSKPFSALVKSKKK